VGAVSLSADSRLRTELAGYRVEALIGRGGMGVVYRAQDLALDRPVALKVLSPELAEDVRFRERFLRESRLAASIDHPSIVPVYDAGELARQLYIAMRYVEGADLKQLLAVGPLEPVYAVGVVERVAAAGCGSCAGARASRREALERAGRRRGARLSGPISV
jgi:serine/threonine-protein kinase